jgi:hypothetical protein
MSVLNHRQRKRARALALQIYSAGRWYPAPKWSDELYFFATRRSVAKKIIEGQMKVLKLNQDIIDYALSMVTLI